MRAFNPLGGVAVLLILSAPGCADRHDVRTTDRGLEIAFAPDGRRLLTGGYEGDLCVWDADARAVERVLLSRPARPLGDAQATIGSVAWAANGTLLASVWDGTVRLWAASGWRPEATFRTAVAHNAAVALSPDGRWLAYADGEKPLRHHLVIRDLTGGVATRRVEFGEPAYLFMSGQAFSADGSRLLVLVRSTGDSTRWRAHVVDRDLGATVASFDCPDASCSALSPRGDLAVVGTQWPGKLLCFDVAAGRLVSRAANPGRVDDVKFAPGGATLASAGGRNSVYLWSLPDWQRRVLRENCDLQSTRVEAFRLAFAPDGSRLAASDDDGAIAFFDLPRPRTR